MAATTSTETGIGAVVGHAPTDGPRFTAPPDINDHPDRVKFAYWVPNVSGGLVISKIPQRTGSALQLPPLWNTSDPDPRWDYESNVRYAQTAENVGFEYALSQIRFMSGYGAVRTRLLNHANEMLIPWVAGKPARVCFYLPSSPP
jgi:hypothetical protein